MEFCPKCGAMLIPKDGNIKCKCGFEKSLLNDEFEEQYNFEAEKNS